MPLLIGNDDVARVMDVRACIEAVEAGLREEAEGAAVNRNKSNIHLPTDDPATWYRYCTIEGGIRKAGVVALRIKSDMVSWPERFGMPREVKYCVQPGLFCGLILLFSARNGELLAIMNDGVIQHLRVAAVGALAARHAARQDARVLGILGSGGMAETHAQGIAAVSGIREIRVYSPNPENRRAFAARMEQELKMPVLPVDDSRDAVVGCDVVACCTDAVGPVVEPDWVAPGMFISCVKQLELHPDAHPKVDRLVLYRSAITDNHFTTPEDWRPIGPGGSNARVAAVESVLADRTVRLPDVLVGRAVARATDQEITLFKSEGTGVQFSAAALKAYELVTAAGGGRELPLDWFLQDIRD
jgi:alanine dehydrogenase